ncbi:hypothetical protein BJ742DRAFT_844052 [Cladochytrium replicatum]|nr:hypothetical protein BJ742DRAFT_844052 [Cladochytrium replicatum]
MCTVVHGAAMGGGRLLSLKLSHGYRLSKSLAQVLGNVTLINEPDAPPPLHVRLDPESSSQPPSGNSIALPGRTALVPPAFGQQSEEGSAVKTSPSPFTLVRNYHCGLAYTVLSSLALLECLHLTNCYHLSSDEMSKLMHAFPGLKKLSLAGCGPAAADGVVEAIAETCVNLVDLDLSECHFIEDASVTRLADNLGDRLKRLNLHYCDLVTDRGVSHLSKRCIKLEALDVANCDVGDVTIREIANNLSDTLQSLNIRECYRITDSSIVYLFQRATKLKSVDLSFTNITDSSLRELGNTKLHPRQLQELALIACRGVSVCAIFQAARGCPRLQRVWIRRCRQMWASTKSSHHRHNESDAQRERVPPLKEFLHMYPNISVDVDVDVDVEYDGGNGEDDANEGGCGECDFDALMRNLLAASVGPNLP